MLGHIIVNSILVIRAVSDNGGKRLALIVGMSNYAIAGSLPKMATGSGVEGATVDGFTSANAGTAALSKKADARISFFNALTPPNSNKDYDIQ